MSRLREPFNALSHFIGAGLGLLVLVAMVIKALVAGSWLYFAGTLVFGLSMIGLYTMSGIYHGLKVSDRVIAILRKVDHTMIYILIAGTYTPVTLMALDGWWRLGLLIGIWSFALLGILTKWLWFGMPRILYTGIYVVMGWLALVAIWPLYQSLSHLAFVALVAGGVLYTVGALIYAFKPRFLKLKIIGFHEWFHMLILAGSASHVIMIFTLV